MKLKKILAGALGAVFMAVGLPQIVIATDDEGIKTFGDFEYVELEDGTLSIALYIGEGGDVVIPAEIDEKSVTEIATYAFSSNTGTSAHRGNYNCTYITSVNIPKSIVSIKSWAFDSCANLVSINIPDSVTEIGDHAFMIVIVSLKSRYLMG